MGTAYSQILRTRQKRQKSFRSLYRFILGFFFPPFQNCQTRDLELAAVELHEHLVGKEDALAEADAVQSPLRLVQKLGREPTA